MEEATQSFCKACAYQGEGLVCFLKNQTATERDQWQEVNCKDRQGQEIINQIFQTQVFREAIEKHARVACSDVNTRRVLL